MMAMSHVLTGLGVWSITAHHTGYDLTPMTLGAAMLGSLLPDIDHPGSWLGRRIMPFSLALSALIGHRGLTHSLLAVIALSLVLYLYGHLAGDLVAALIIGYLVHLLGDFITNSGIPLLWPWKRRFAVTLANTGSLAEYGIVTALVLGGVFLYREDITQQWNLISQGAGVWL